MIQPAALTASGSPALTSGLPGGEIRPSAPVSYAMLFVSGDGGL